MKAAHHTRKQYLYVNADHGLKSGIRPLLFLSAVHLIDSTVSPKSVLAIQLPLYPFKNLISFRKLLGNNAKKYIFDK